MNVLAIAGQGGLVDTLLSSSSHGIRLAKLLNNATFIGVDDVVAASCCGHWTDCQEDDLYVAIVGPECDGHDFVHEAIQRGARAIVTERLLAVDFPQVIVPDTRLAYGSICHALGGQPCDHLTTIGVSGTDGKTVTAHLIRCILTEAGKQTGLTSSIEVNLGAKQQAVPSSDFNAPTLANQLAQMAMNGCSHAVVEVPSESLAQHSIAGVNFDVSVLTNIRREGIADTGSFRNYRRANLRMLDSLKSSGLAILNADDPVINSCLDKIEVPFLTTAIKQEAEITAKLIERARSEQTFLLKAGNESVPVRTSIIGDQHIRNCLAAAATGLSLGISLTTIAAGLEKAGQLPGRLERVECGQQFSVWVDAARTVGQLANALRTVRQVTSGQVWCICTIEDNQTTELRRRLGEVIDRAADQSVITRATVDSMVDYEPVHQVLDGFRNPGDAELIPDRFKAIEWVLANAKTGDSVLVAGCGERPFAILGDENWTVTDRDVCQAWLYDHASLKPGGSMQPGSNKQDIYRMDDYR